MTLLWTLLTGGPAIRVNNRPKHRHSTRGSLDKIVNGELTFTVLIELAFAIVTGPTNNRTLLNAQLKVPRRRSNLLGLITLPNGVGVRLPTPETRPLVYLLQGRPVVIALPTLLLETTCPRPALTNSTPFGLRWFPQVILLGCILMIFILDERTM